ncbi:MAG TPA: hypothetical protein VN673_01695 [Clostridia bacterium]|nr:hypothetical protein [Clostridia bacterium]
MTKPVHTEEYDCKGTMFRIDVFKSRLGFWGCWTRLRDGETHGSSKYGDNIEDVIIYNKANLYGHRD